MSGFLWSFETTGQWATTDSEFGHRYGRRISGASAIPIIGEFGILINARMSTVDDNRCFLTMNYGATRYIACLWLDDKEFCRRLVDLLKKHHGEPIDQIAELEIPVKLLSSRSSESSLMAK